MSGTLSLALQCNVRAQALDPHRWTVGKLCYELQLSAHAFDVVAQGREKQITALFHSRDGVLAHARR